MASVPNHPIDRTRYRRLDRRVLATADLGAVVAALIAVLAFSGFTFDFPHLIVTRAGMSPVTTLGICLLAIAIMLSAREYIRIAAASTAPAAALGLAVLASRLVSDTDQVSGLVASLLPGDSPRGMTAPATACCIVLVAGAVILRRAYPRLSNTCSGMGMAITGTVLLGYAYGPEQIGALEFFSGVTLPTASALFLLSLGAIFIEHRTGWSAVIAAPAPGGGATRRQLLFTLVPPVAAWALLRLATIEKLGMDAAVTLLVIVTIVPLALLVLRDGRILATLDAERQKRAAFLDAHNRDMERQLKRQARQIEREVEERRKVEAAMYATQRLETVGQLTGGIAHDFNNLLMGVSGNLQLLRRKLPEDHPAMRNAIAAGAAVERGTRLTSQLLTFSRSQRLDIRAVEIRPLLAQARELIGNALGPDIDIEIRDHSEGTWARTDGDQLELAILNLVVNARDAMPGGGRVTIEAERLKHVFNTGEPVAAIGIRIIDTGVGMSPEIAARAIEPFFTTKERGKGTGLGLAQAHGFALQCGGDLRLFSVPGAGTTVELLLRETEAVAAEQIRPAATQDDAGLMNAARKRLLVIDDDEDVRRVIVELLGSAGFEVTESADGRSGLEQLAAWRPDAAVIDFIMPGMNGAEVARRAQELHPGLPILFVSGYSDTVALDGIADAMVLRKPFNDDSLQRAVARILH
ncbi:ATP-binding protein [Xylophilus sp. GOD-11R]|uniref:ATP-binding protein n=1 Tax=Xylophilus sp. GOD-11R TaxID=3089814 RepID=UPI00298D0C86|nr:ATP-binding protein [Xylophilus sp. GOD-11R]WPB59150.1 response regulator [Xylophilus sp. GOD-11R]